MRQRCSTSPFDDHHHTIRTRWAILQPHCPTPSAAARLGHSALSQRLATYPGPSQDSPATRDSRPPPLISQAYGARRQGRQGRREKGGAIHQWGTAIHQGGTPTGPRARPRRGPHLRLGLVKALHGATAHSLECMCMSLEHSLALLSERLCSHPCGSTRSYTHSHTRPCHLDRRRPVHLLSR